MNSVYEVARARQYELRGIPDDGAPTLYQCANCRAFVGEYIVDGEWRCDDCKHLA